MITSFVGDIFFSWLIFFFFGRRPTKKKYSAKQKKYSPTNEVTHPTETPLCLWYFVFMPPILKIFRISMFFQKYWGFFVTNHYPYENFRGYFKHFLIFVFCTIWTKNPLKKNSRGIPYSKLKTFIMFSKWSKVNKNNKSCIRWSIIVPTLLFSKIVNSLYFCNGNPCNFALFSFFPFVPKLLKQQFSI